jgi:hypothetical protein
MSCAMSTRVLLPPRMAIVSALARAGIVWGFTVFWLYGSLPPTRAPAPAVVVLLAGLPALALASWLWAILAERRKARCSAVGRGGTMLAWSIGSLVGGLVPALALSAVPSGAGLAAMAGRLLLGATALLVPLWVWLGGRAADLMVTVAAPRRSGAAFTVREDHSTRV